MQIKDIQLINYRNYQNREISFEKSINLITGQNGQGKSNLIEAIQLLSTLRSIKTHQTKELIMQQKDHALLKATVCDDNHGENKIQIQIQDQQKTIKINQKILNKSSELLKIFSTVTITHEDINIIDGEPTKRRKYLDIILSKTDNYYMHELKDLKRIIKLKNIVLKTEKIQNQTLLEDYQQKMTDLNKQLVKKRKEFVLYIEKKLNKYLKEYFARAQYKNIQIFYKDTMGEYPGQEILNKERQYRECLYGAHRDDFSVQTGETEVKKYLSLGEKRILSILLKLAEKDYYVEKYSISPVVLVDDAFMGLDAEKAVIMKNLLDMKLQVIVTSTEKSVEVFKAKVNIIEI
ncbi:MAG: DNA replication and repair protein RecF [Candidatus Margulisbacteria bacterium]|nr:DNA replication and repair protein RecF [Candidatus Margulisiibacteriota bacterium]